MIDKCSQYQQDYEKLFLLKQEFNAALENSVKSRNFEEAKRIKIELETIIEKFDDILWKQKAEKQVIEMYKSEIDNENDIKKYIDEHCIFDNKNKTIILNTDLIMSDTNITQIPDSMHVKGIIDFRHAIQLKELKNLTAEAEIKCSRSGIEEINGDISTKYCFECICPSLKNIKGNITASSIDFSKTISLDKITGSIRCHKLLMTNTKLKQLPDELYVDEIVIDFHNTELLDSANKLFKVGKIKAIYEVR